MRSAHVIATAQTHTDLMRDYDVLMTVMHGSVLRPLATRDSTVLHTALVTNLQRLHSECDGDGDNG